MAKLHRTISRVVRAQNTSDGAGVKLKRTIGSFSLENLDPFLMLDEFVSEKGSDYIAGFPSHPHRGFETVTYMIHGKMQHKDNHGNEGIIESGGVQWMTAGRGIVHSEMPLQEDGLMWGFQLWVNLPAHKKMTAPRYQDIPASEVPSYTYDNGNHVRVIAGELGTETQTISGCVKDIVTSPLFLDVALKKGQEFQYPISAEAHGFLYTFQGQVEVEGQAIPAHHLGVLSEDSAEQLTVHSPDQDSRFLLVAGKPLNEPIAKRGPFVMNTPQELQQAIVDYQMGRF
uniref:Pirin n=1 Tax=Vannella robusta TaxID=1487602 RepID=A0A7S4IJ96_9EUKA|mmetsp:Transcript_340/g.440  ORF Transcript_340/g.440 Transcript_340/m.440 type:complete len:285 (+) Transcript_340:890-1744(+)